MLAKRTDWNPENLKLKVPHAGSSFNPSREDQKHAFHKKGQFIKKRKQRWEKIQNLHRHVPHIPVVRPYRSDSDDEPPIPTLPAPRKTKAEKLKAKRRKAHFDRLNSDKIKKKVRVDLDVKLDGIQNRMTDRKDMLLEKRIHNRKKRKDRELARAPMSKYARGDATLKPRAMPMASNQVLSETKASMREMECNKVDPVGDQFRRFWEKGMYHSLGHRNPKKNKNHLLPKIKMKMKKEFKFLHDLPDRTDSDTSDSD